MAVESPASIAKPCLKAVDQTRQEAIVLENVDNLEEPEQIMHLAGLDPKVLWPQSAHHS